MGPKMTHFEGPIDPITGTVKISHVFKPIVVSPETEDHMTGHFQHDPQDKRMKIQVNWHLLL